MYLLLIFLSVTGSFLSGLFGRFLGSMGSSIITTSCLAVSFLTSIFIFYEVSLVGCFVYIKLFTWINSEILNIDWGFMFDSLTVVMCFVITFISLLVHLYSTEYMSHDPHIARFVSYLSLFTFFMLILVTGDNFVQMFVGWEGVGLCSYLLINFWFTRIQANKAAIKAMILNRIGDFSLVIGILIIFTIYKSVDYATVAVLTPFFKYETVNFLNINCNILNMLSILLLVGCAGKSAQLGLHTWLPDAMDAPTPVSALLHAATMVVSGVFLLARASFIYECSTSILKYVAFLGAITAFVAATTGLVQNDLKRVIAYSTCSQLGYMVFACGLSNYSVAIFHFSNHAFFKALLFLSAGSVIHSVNDEQDLRKMGGLKLLIPFTYSMMVIGSLALIGFPFLTGFYSKDLILEVAYGKYSTVGYFSYFLGAVGALLTAFYSTRLLYFTFLSKPTGFKQIIYYASDSGILICLALGCLSIPSMFIGFYSKDMLVGVGGHFFGTAIFINPNLFNLFDAEAIPLFYKTLPVHLSLLGLVLAFTLYNFYYYWLFNIKISFTGKKFYNFLNKKWFFDKVYNEFLSQVFFKFSFSVSYKFVDKGVFELLGPTGLSILSLFVGSSLHRLQTNNLYHVLAFILISVSLLLIFKECYLFMFTLKKYYFNFIDIKLFVLSIFLIFFFVNYFENIK